MNGDPEILRKTRLNLRIQYIEALPDNNPKDMI